VRASGRRAGRAAPGTPRVPAALPRSRRSHPSVSSSATPRPRDRRPGDPCVPRATLPGGRRDRSPRRARQTPFRPHPSRDRDPRRRPRPRQGAGAMPTPRRPRPGGSRSISRPCPSRSGRAGQRPSGGAWRGSTRAWRPFGRCRRGRSRSLGKAPFAGSSGVRSRPPSRHGPRATGSGRRASGTAGPSRSDGKRSSDGPTFRHGRQPRAAWSAKPRVAIGRSRGPWSGPRSRARARSATPAARPRSTSRSPPGWPRSPSGGRRW